MPKKNELTPSNSGEQNDVIIYHSKDGKMSVALTRVCPAGTHMTAVEHFDAWIIDMKHRNMPRVSMKLSASGNPRNPSCLTASHTFE